MTTATLNSTLADAIWPHSAAASGPRAVILGAIGVALLWLSAKIQIPLWPVPLTMQTFVVLTIGLAYGTRLGTATVAVYLVAGAVGLPMFAGGWTEGGGIQHLYGTTGGYLVGFVVAAALCGRLAARGWDRSPLFAAASMLAGNLVIYALGVSWLAIQIGVEGAIAYGLLPFLLGDALKIALGAATLPIAWKLIGRRSR
jgi:biotin transport system substrate-specific component